MNHRDFTTLRTWLMTGQSLAGIESAERYGIVENERFSEHARRAYRLLWTWTAPRFSGMAGWKQDRCYAKLGSGGLERRIARARAVSNRIMRG